MNGQSQQCDCRQVRSSSILNRGFVGIQNAFLDKLFWVRSALQTLLEAVGPHVVFELSLLLLQGRRGVGRR